MLVALTETLIIPDITKPESNILLLNFFKAENNDKHTLARNTIWNNAFRAQPTDHSVITHLKKC